MDLRMHKFLIAAISVSLGSISAVVSYIVANVMTPHTATYQEFVATTPEVRAGGELRIRATYEKRYDCGGVMIVTIDDAGPHGPRVIHSQALGDRPPGVWTIPRTLRIPPDVLPGPATVQESLAYSCGWKSETVRSPLLRIQVKEE